MLPSSTIINRSLRTYVMPALRAGGFEKVDARNAWNWRSECIWVFNIRAVGNYFSAVTGWPPASVCVWLGVYYRFIPRTGKIKTDEKGRVCPAEFACHMRSHLDRGLLQRDRVGTLRSENPAERSRRDIWWLDPDGTNAEEVARDIAARVSETAIPWFTRCTDLKAALSEVEAGHDCFIKFVLAAYVAGRLENVALRDKYTRLAEEEGLRIGHVPDKEKWFPLEGV
ncbi:MAG: DUF4304 domain-containing protein [Planctomycetota bacterium]